MIRMLFFFVVLWIIVTAGINVWREMKGKERWETVKTLAYGFTTAVITFVLLTIMVVLF